MTDLLREVDVKRDVVALYRSVGCYVLDTTQPRPSMVAKGLPDLIVLLPRGNGCAFHEVKAPRGKQSDTQVLVQVRAEQSGTRYLLGGVDVAKAFLVERGLLVG